MSALNWEVMLAGAQGAAAAGLRGMLAAVSASVIRVLRSGDGGVRLTLVACTSGHTREELLGSALSRPVGVI